MYYVFTHRLRKMLLVCLGFIILPPPSLMCIGVFWTVKGNVLSKVVLSGAKLLVTRSDTLDISTRRLTLHKRMKTFDD